MDNIIIGRNISIIRDKLNFTQEETAKYLGVERSLLSKIEHGTRSVNLELLEKLADLFGVNLNIFFEEDEELVKVNRAFAYRHNNLSVDDLNVIANFQNIVTNYIKMQNILKNNVKKS